MKNRLLHIRISQALPHCIESSQAEMVHGARACVCVCARVCVCACVCAQPATCMLSRRKALTFFNYSLVGDVNSLILNRLRQKCKKRRWTILAHKRKEGNKKICVHARTKATGTISQHGGSGGPFLLLLSRSVFTGFLFFLSFPTDGRVSNRSQAADLNNDAVSPHNPDLILPSYWLHSQGNF